MKMKPIWFALILGGFAFVSLTLLVYAFMQKKEAERQASIVIENEMRVIECERRSVEANQQLQQALDAIAQKTQLLEQQAASKSKNKK
jgi:Flp pilus assembly protein TadB